MVTKTKKGKKIVGEEARLVSTEVRKVPLEQVVSNSGQSRGMGVLYRLHDMGYGLFERLSVDKTKESVWNMLFSDQPEDRAFAVQLIEENEGEIVDLHWSLTTSVQLQPVGVWKCGEGKAEEDEEYDVIFGMRRVLALAYGFAKNGTPTDIEAKVFEFDGNPTAVQLRLLALDENDNRVWESPIDKALTYKWLRDQGMTLEQVGQRYKINGKPQSPQNVKNYTDLLDKRLEPERMKIHTGRLSVDQAIKLLKARKEGKEGHDRGKENDRNGSRDRLPGVKGLIKLYDARKKPKSMPDEEWELWTDEGVRKLLAYKLKLTYREFEPLEEPAKPAAKPESENGNGKAGTATPAGGKKVLNVPRARAIKLLEEIGKTGAKTWDDDLIKDKLENIVTILEDDGPRPDSGTPMDKLLNKLVSGYAAGIGVKIID